MLRVICILLAGSPHSPPSLSAFQYHKSFIELHSYLQGLPCQTHTGYNNLRSSDQPKTPVSSVFRLADTHGGHEHEDSLIVINHDYTTRHICRAWRGIGAERRASKGTYRSLVRRETCTRPLEQFEVPESDKALVLFC